MAENDLSVLKIDKSQITRRSGKKRLVYLLLPLLVLTGLALLYRAGLLTPAVKVEVARVMRFHPSEAFTQLNASGYVVAQRRAAVASKITARLVGLYVEEGSPVKTGQEIARLESDDAAAVRDRAAANLEVARFNIEQAEAELHDAALSHRRNRQLLAREYISRAEYDSGQARYRTARAALEAAKAALAASRAALKAAQVNLDYTIIRAPFDATVLTKNADIGDIVTPLGAAADAKSAVVTIADMDSLMVEVDVSESNIGRVYHKQPCEIRLDALPGERFAGSVHMIVPTADRSKASVMVKIAFAEKDARILPEMSAKAAFLARTLSAFEKMPFIAVPAAALMQRNGRNTVFVVQGGRAIEKTVETGRRIGGMIEIKSGLMAGETVIEKPLERLKNGVRVVSGD